VKIDLAKLEETPEEPQNKNPQDTQPATTRASTPFQFVDVSLFVPRRSTMYQSGRLLLFSLLFFFFSCVCPCRVARYESLGAGAGDGGSGVDAPSGKVDQAIKDAEKAARVEKRMKVIQEPHEPQES
jgi:hypothetical protein